MRNKILNYLLNKINKEEKYDKDILLYALEGLYILFTKTIIIIGIILLLGNIERPLLFIMFFILIRTFSFGIHLDNSYKCLMLSIFLFVIFPHFIFNLKLNMYLEIIIAIFNVVNIFLYAPADTYKRPIYNRFKYRAISIIIVLLLTTLSFINPYLKNVILFSGLTQVFLIHPLTYKIFKKPYRNYERR